MTAFTKHVGVNEHGSRLVVVFREVPGEEENCLVVLSDSLMDMYHDQFMREVTSKEAQNTVNLYEVLERRTFGDGAQMLNGLHAKGLLKKWPVADIQMQPMPNRLVPLTMVNEQIATGEISEEVKVEASDVVEDTSTDTGVSVDTDAGIVDKVKVEPVVIGTTTNQTPEEATEAAAESKLLQARLMEEDAKTMREEAYALNPALKKGGRPKKAK